jgi:Tfp pilus assembly protein FimV
MKSKHVVLLSLVFLWALTSCVFEDELVMQDTPLVDAEVEQVTADAAETAVDKLDTALAELPFSPSAEVAKARLPRQYMVQRGDTLRDIAVRAGIYWNGTLWSGIYNANRDKIATPDLILPGIVLTIPSLRGEIREGMWEAGRDYENPFAGR